jgi:hypothetical protein
MTDLSPLQPQGRNCSVSGWNIDDHTGMKYALTKHRHYQSELSSRLPATMDDTIIKPNASKIEVNERLKLNRKSSRSHKKNTSLEPLRLNPNK